VQRIHQVVLIIPAALLLLFGAYVYLIGTVHEYSSELWAYP
jgi:hypothetical protein